MANFTAARTIANQEFTLSAHYNKIQPKGKSKATDKDNNIIKAFRAFELENEKAIIECLRSTQFAAFCNVMRNYWDKERKTASEGITWNIWKKIDNKEKFAFEFVLQALNDMDKNWETYKEKFAFAAKHKPASKPA